MWPEVLVVAFVAQLAVLPGEKVQFIVAGLSTRYDPLVVVPAAGSAFAGWTALEVLLGDALQRLLPPLVLDGVTAGMFLLFAVLLYRSAPAPGESVVERVAGPEPDGGVPDADSGTTADGATAAAPGATDDGETVAASGETADGPAAGTSATAAWTPTVPAPEEVTVLGHEVPDRLGGFLSIFAMMAAGEFGDKTQLVTITLAARYGAHPAIWAGEMLAILPVTVANAYVFHRFAGRFDLRKAHLAAAALFLFFAADTLVAMATGVSVWETVVGVVADAVLGVV